MLSILLLLGLLSTMTTTTQMRLAQAPTNIEVYHEIATQYNQNLPDLWNNLTPHERVFAYYIFRASLPGNRILADQYHRHSLQITEIFQTILLNADCLRARAIDGPSIPGKPARSSRLRRRTGPANWFGCARPL